MIESDARVFWDHAVMLLKCTTLALALLMLTGCGFLSLGRPSLASDDPALKIPAMKMAAREHNRAAIPLLIKALSSQDSAIRFYAINALHKITGHQFGYVYYAPRRQRNMAITRWRQFSAAQSAARPGSGMPGATGQSRLPGPALPWRYA
jgi:hypothetical protein